MPEHEARVRAFYDHEAEDSGAGRGRRQVADWGVGEDVFDRLPSRRFSRVGGAHARRAAEAEPPAEHAPPADRAPAAQEWPPSRSHRALAADDEPPGRPRRTDDDERPTGRPRRAAAAEAAPPASRHPRSAEADVPRGRTDDGRRTIVIGEPREPAEPEQGRRTVVIGAHSAARRRPPRTAAERVGPRPDRIVAYAVGLGILLILIAVLSAGH